MENSFKLKGIICDLHPKEFLTSVCLDPECDKLLFCNTCAQQSEANISHQKLMTLEEFFIKADALYSDLYKKAEKRTRLPQEFIEVLSKAEDHVMIFTKHIENQKKDIEWSMNEIIKKITDLFEKRKKEIYANFDTLLATLKKNYEFFEKKVKRFYCVPKDDKIFPNLQEINRKLQSIYDSKQLLPIIKEMKCDMYDILNPKDESIFLVNLQKLGDEIISKSTDLVSFVDKKIVLNYNLDIYLQEHSKQLLDRVFIQKGYIGDLENAFVNSLPSSSILKNVFNVALLRKWIDPNSTKRIPLKLLYASRKHGTNAENFHKEVDGNANTITICQTIDGMIFGGFLEKPWNKVVNWIKSDKAWLFSINNKQKFNIKPNDTIHAAYSNTLYGPSFGGGFDISIPNDFKSQSCSCTPYSYENYTPEKLTGKSVFHLKEIEVYQVFFMANKSKTSNLNVSQSNLASEDSLVEASQLLI